MIWKLFNFIISQLLTVDKGKLKMRVLTSSLIKSYILFLKETTLVEEWVLFTISHIKYLY